MTDLDSKLRELQHFMTIPLLVWRSNDDGELYETGTQLDEVPYSYTLVASRPNIKDGWIKFELTGEVAFAMGLFSLRGPRL